MKTAVQFFAEYFECEVREAKECHHMTIKCMEAFAKEACREQREICEKAIWPESIETNIEAYVLKATSDAIKNAPEPKI